MLNTRVPRGIKGCIQAEDNLASGGAGFCPVLQSMLTMVVWGVISSPSSIRPASRIPGKLLRENLIFHQFEIRGLEIKLELISRNSTVIKCFPNMIL